LLTDKSISGAWILLPSLCLALGCSGAGSDPTDAVTQALSSPSVVASFDPAQGQLPEAVTADDDGNFYFSMGNAVQRLDRPGNLALYASLPVPASAFTAGVKFGPDGKLYVCTAAFDPTLDASYVFRVSHNGSVVESVAHLDPTGFPNDLAFDDDRN